jgi:peptidylprolyl isomerase
VGCVSSPRQTPETLTPVPLPTGQITAGSDSSRVDTTFVRPDLSKFVRQTSGLMYRDVTIGAGIAVTDSREVELHYAGWLENGTLFDSSLRRDQSFTFVFGQGRVIPGWEQGLRGVRAGGRRILVIPPELAYGPDGQPPTIPANATLIFDIQLIAVR